MEIQGLRGFLSSLNRANNNFDDEAKKTMRRVGLNLKKKVGLKTPVDTGTLRRSWHYKTLNESEGIVYNNTKYASMVEYGHRTRGGKSFVDGRYMLTKSVKEIENELDNEFNIMIDNLFR